MYRRIEFFGECIKDGRVFVFVSDSGLEIVEVDIRNRDISV